MSLAQDLLEQAQHLARRERGRPRQASLRRAISTAYYALFHLLIDEATSILISRPELRARFARAFEHGDMKQASRAFAGAQPPGYVGAVSIPPELQRVALAFVELQEMRHEADYSPDRSFTRSECVNLVERVEEAFATWQTIRNDPVARTYLAALLLWRKWGR